MTKKPPCITALSSAKSTKTAVTEIAACWTRRGLTVNTDGKFFIRIGDNEEKRNGQIVFFPVKKKNSARRAGEVQG